MIVEQALYLCAVSLKSFQFNFYLEKLESNVRIWVFENGV